MLRVPELSPDSFLPYYLTAFPLLLPNVRVRVRVRVQACFPKPVPPRVLCRTFPRPTLSPLPFPFKPRHHRLSSVMFGNFTAFGKHHQPLFCFYATNLSGPLDAAPVSIYSTASPPTKGINDLSRTKHLIGPTTLLSFPSPTYLDPTLPLPLPLPLPFQL